MSRNRSLLPALCLVSAYVLTPTAFAAPLFSQTIDSGPNINFELHRPFALTYTFTGLPAFVGDALLTVTATGDIGGINEYLRVDDRNGAALGFVFGDDVSGAEPITITDTLSIPLASIGSALLGDSLTLTFVSDPSFASAYAAINSLTLSAPAPVPSPTTAALLGAGLLSLGIARSRRRP